MSIFIHNLVLVSLILQMLQQKFEDFIHDLNSSEERITKVTLMGTAMIEVEHFESEKIQMRLDEISQMWLEVKDVTKARQDVSIGNDYAQL